MSKVILDLCAGTGAWSAPYLEAGYDVRRIDLPTDVRLGQYPWGIVQGVLAAPPCTVFSYARNRYEPTDEELRNKLRRYLGPPTWVFRQWEYGDAGEKPTALWGDFKPPMLRPGERTKPSTFKTQYENARPEDAITPPNFARAFFEANP